MNVLAIVRETQAVQVLILTDKGMLPKGFPMDRISTGSDVHKPQICGQFQSFAMAMERDARTRTANADAC